MVNYFKYNASISLKLVVFSSVGFFSTSSVNSRECIDCDDVSIRSNFNSHSQFLSAALQYSAGVEYKIQNPNVSSATSNTNVGDRFGFSVAIYGDTAIVGSAQEDVGTNIDQGAVYVFKRVGTAWIQRARLLANDGAASDQFGHALALTANTAIVGAHQSDIGNSPDQGAVYVFTRNGDSWGQQAKLFANDGAWYDLFGCSIAADESRIIVGSCSANVNGSVDQGAAYVFARSDDLWNQESKLIALDGGAGDYFGWSVGISGDNAIVGAFLNDAGAVTNRGSAYVFNRSNGNWDQQAQLLANDGASSDHFGFSVAISGDSALVGVRSDDIGSNLNQGSAYFYLRNGSNWESQARINSSDGADRDQFGYSVALSENIALIGAVSARDNLTAQKGAAYVFYSNGLNWEERTKLTASDGNELDNFGFRVALSGERGLIGVPYDDSDLTISIADVGSAYIYEIGIFSDGFEINGD